MYYDAIQISKINDFVFCPRSLFLHGIYESFSNKTYHHSPQTKGKIKHEKIDHQKYSTARRYIQGAEIYSEKYHLIGKIDVYDKMEKSIIERKSKIKKIYDGYKYQLYAQYFCLKEMGYAVEKLFFHSLDDNKRYEIDLPKGKELKKFEQIIKEIRCFKPSNEFRQNPLKCEKCIYKELC